MFEEQKKRITAIITVKILISLFGFQESGLRAQLTQIVFKQNVLSMTSFLYEWDFTSEYV